MSLPHLPTSANFHQDIILHIQEDHQWRVRLMHSLILMWFLSPFQLPNSLRHDFFTYSLLKSLSAICRYFLPFYLYYFVLVRVI